MSEQAGRLVRRALRFDFYEIFAGRLAGGFDECWIWPGTIGNHGYGLAQIDGRKRTTHKSSYEYYYGETIAKDHYCCHTCNVKACFNPTHLYAGTAFDNAMDTVEAGLNLKKLTPERRDAMLADNRSITVVGREYGIHPTMVWRARRNHRARLLALAERTSRIEHPADFKPRVRQQRKPTLKWDVEAIFSDMMATKSRDECWDWPGTKSNGYGSAWHGKKNVPVHRWTYEKVFGPMAPGMHGCHKCDRKICCNPYHIFQGTNEDNQRDKVAKRRHRWKLTEDQICAIAIDPRRYEEIATEYDVNISIVHDIKLRKKKYWVTLEARGVIPVLPNERHRVRKLTEEQARVIYHDPRTVRVIAAEYGISSPTVVGIKNGDYWPYIHAEALMAGRGHVKNPRKRQPPPEQGALL